MKRCAWCGVFVAASMPRFTWYRDWPSGGVLGWTDPQHLCPDDAASAADWRGCHQGEFAEVD